MPRRPRNAPGAANDAQRHLLALLRTLRYIAEHEPGLDELCGGLGISRPTAVRHIRAARQVLGMTILSRRAKGVAAHYAITDYGMMIRERLMQ